MTEEINNHDEPITQPKNEFYWNTPEYIEQKKKEEENERKQKNKSLTDHALDAVTGGWF